MNVEGIAQIYISDSEKAIQTRTPGSKNGKQSQHSGSPGKPNRKLAHTTRSMSDPNFRSGRGRRNRSKNTKEHGYGNIVDSDGETVGAEGGSAEHYPTRNVSATDTHASTTYWWQIGPDVEIMMEERRQQLLELGDLSENDELVEEWLALLLAREEVMAAHKHTPPNAVARMRAGHTANVSMVRGNVLHTCGDVVVHRSRSCTGQKIAAMPFHCNLCICKMTMHFVSLHYLGVRQWKSFCHRGRLGLVAIHVDAGTCVTAPGVIPRARCSK